LALRFWHAAPLAGQAKRQSLFPRAWIRRRRRGRFSHAGGFLLIQTPVALGLKSGFFWEAANVQARIFKKTKKFIDSFGGWRKFAGLTPKQ